MFELFYKSIYYMSAAISNNFFPYVIKFAYLFVLFSLLKMKVRYHVEYLHVQQKITDLYIRLSECSRLIDRIPQFETGIAIPKNSNSLLHNNLNPSEVTAF